MSIMRLPKSMRMLAVTSIIVMVGSGLSIAGAGPAAADGSTTADSFLSVTAFVSGEGQVGSMGIAPNPPPTFKPNPPANCGQPVPSTSTNPVTKKVTPITLPPDCNPNDGSKWRQPGDSGTETYTRAATWPADQIIWGADDVQYGGGSGGISRSGPSGLPSEGSPPYDGQCRNDFRPVPGGFGLTGYMAPQAVNYTVSKTTRINDARNPVVVDVSITWGNCVWPSVTSVNNLCPLWAGDGAAYGPTGKGLPVQDSVKGLDPMSIARTVAPLQTADGETRVYSDVGIGFAGKDTYTKASMVYGCNRNLMARFRFEPNHPGNFALTATGEAARCGYVTFAGMSKFTGCQAPEFYNFRDTGHMDCQGNIGDGWLNSYDFSCQKPTEVCSPSQPCAPARAPGAVRCTWLDNPVLTTPGGDKVTLDKNNKMPTTQVYANGSPWLINWGDMKVTGATGVTSEWSDWFVTKDSSPGNTSMDASNTKQPFNGEYNNKRVLMWENTPTDLGKGIQGTPWPQTLNMFWYLPGNDGKTFTVYQNRSFTWTNTYTMTNWDGSTTPMTTNPVNQTCGSTQMPFQVVQGRSAGG